MRFLLAVMAVTVALSMSGAAQQKTKPFKLPPPSADSKSEPKSTVPPPKTPTAAASSKDLQKVENEGVKGGRGGQAKKTHTPVVKADKGSGNNPAINFNGKGGGTSGTSTRTPGSLKGRLKQKGQGNGQQH